MEDKQVSASMLRQIVELEYKSISELRSIYKNLFNITAASNANKDLLIPKIAYRIQELALGGLSDKAKLKLETLAKGGVTATLRRKHSDLLPGTKICKEYNKVIHQVEVMKDGFEYNGQKWKSLSAIATKITGTKWNGPKFFGMRG
jgi:hypothetical protein